MVTRKIACIVVTSITVFFILYSSINILPNYRLLTQPNSTYAFCTPVSNKDYIRSILPWIDTIFHSIAPSVIMIISNVLIIWRLKQAAKFRRSMTSEGAGVDDKYGGTKVAVMLITVSVFFVCTTLPRGIFFIGKIKHSLF